MLFRSSYSCINNNLYSIKGVTGLLHQINMINNKPETSYVLTICNFYYTINKSKEIHRRKLKVNYSNPIVNNENSPKCLMIRPDPIDSVVAIALNSHHKYYCQVILMSLYTGFGNNLFKT